MSLEARLRDADDAAKAVAAAQSGDPPTADDLAVLAQRAAIVDRFLSDVNEAVKQVAVAGLAYPDPELPDELGALARRAKRLAVPTGTRCLLRLRALLLALSEATEPLERNALSGRAWHETQRLVSWLRMFRTEHDFLTVQGRITASSQAQRTAPRPPRYPTRSMSVWPVGVELAFGGKVVIWARGLEGDADVLLFDELAEHDVADPFGGRAISRLFQDGVLLGEVLAGIIRFQDHPVVDKDGLSVFRAAFQAVPSRHGVASTFEPPEVPRIPLAPLGQPDLTWTGRVGALDVTVARSGQRVSVCTRSGSPAQLHLSPLLRFNLTKLLMREGEDAVDATLVARIKDKQLQPLGMHTDFDGRCFPASDPRVYRTHASVLQRRIDADSLPADTLYGLWLRAAAAGLSGATTAQRTALGAALETLDLVGIEDHYRAGLIRHLLNVPEVPEGLFALLVKALTLGAAPEADPVDLADLAEVLELPLAEVSPADRRLLDGRLLYQAVWLTLEADWVDDLIEPLLSLYQVRYAGQLKSPSPADVCVRALLVAIVGAGDDVDAVEGGDDLEGGFHSAAALAFLEAHLTGYSRRGGRRSKQKPLPEPLELFQLADTRAILAAEQRRGATIDALKLPTGQLRTLLVDRLYPWMVALRHTSDIPARRDAADALLVASASKLKRSLFE